MSQISDRPTAWSEHVSLSIKGKPMAETPASAAARHELPEEFRGRAPSAMEHKFTSTGVKFWKHRDSMQAYKQGTGRSVISTHVSPEGRCNLKCSYCSVSERTLHSTLELPRVKDYVERLMSRGLKAVILTGGGEPTLYKDFNQLGEWILEQGLDLALITNGTQFKRVSDTILKGLSWVRVSMNMFKRWEQLITLPVERLGPQTTYGLSICHSGDNKDSEFLRGVAAFAERHKVSYVRVLPDCMLPQDQLVREHQELVRLLGSVAGGERFFHQFKVHGSPCQSKCHQSFFRPYLSEAIDPATGKPGLVFPCDSVVLNDQAQKFRPRYALCPPEQILDYMDGRITQAFDATVHCTGCVFTRNVDMLDQFVKQGVEQFDQYANVEMHHENFV